MTKIQVVQIEEVEKWEFPLTNWFNVLIEDPYPCAICGKPVTVKCNNGGCDE